VTPVAKLPKASRRVRASKLGAVISICSYP
jgi:hypothetical protein